jgi:hypothetical protein
MKQLNNISASAILLFLVTSMTFYVNNKSAVILLVWSSLLFYGTFIISKLSKRRQGNKKMIAGKSGANLLDIV